MSSSKLEGYLIGHPNPILYQQDDSVGIGTRVASKLSLTNNSIARMAVAKQSHTYNAAKVH